MRLSRRCVLSAAVCILLAASAAVRIPVPPAALGSRLQALLLGDRPGRVTVGSAFVRWGEASLTVEEVEIHEDTGLSILAPEVEVQIGLLPGAADFLRLRAVRFLRPDVTFEPAWLDALRRRAEVRPAAGDLRVPLLIQDGSLHYRDPAGGIAVSARIRRLTGVVAGDDYAFSGALEPPWGGSIRFALDARNAWESWTVDVGSDAAHADLQHARFLPLPVEDSRAGRLAAQALLRGRYGRIASARIDFQMFGWQGALDDPSLGWKEVELRAHGDLDRGVVVAGGGLAGVRAGRLVPVAFEGVLRRTAGQMRLRLDGRAGPVLLDESFQREIETLDAAAGVAVAAFEPRGSAIVRALIGWNEGRPPYWAARASLDGASMVYRGFLEADGEKPAFPYPVDLDSGLLVAAGDILMVELAGAMGVGSMAARGGLRLGGGPAQIEVDARVDGLVLDNNVASYANGTPDLAQLIRDLGGLDGGTADLDIHLRRPYLAPRVGIAMAGVVQDSTVRPIWLPVKARLDRVAFEWTPGLGSFQGDATTMNGRLRLRGRVEEVPGADRPSVLVEAHARDLVPLKEEREILESYLELPSGAAQYAISAGSETGIWFRKPGPAGHSQVLARWSCAAMPMEWVPELLRFRVRSAEAAVFRSGENTAISLPRAELVLDEGPVELSVAVASSGPEGAGRALFATPGLEISERSTRLVARRLGLRDEEGRLGLSGQVAARVEIDPSGSRPPRALLDLQPMTVRSAGVEGPGDEARIRGRLEAGPAGLRSRRLHVSSASGQIALHDLRILPAPDGLRLATAIESVSGVEIGDRFSALASPEGWAALQRLGLTGRVGADRVNLALDLPASGGLSFRADGRLLLRNVALSGPPTMESGAGDLVIEEFVWRSPEDFSARMRLENGAVTVGGISATDANGTVVLDSGAIRLTGFRVRALGGQASTDGLNEDGNPEEGVIELGLTPQAPLRVLLHLEDMSLTRMRQELAFAPYLAGRIWGRLDFRAASPSPLDYTGIGVLAIREGVLGEVPVLTNMWRLAGVQPPQFTTGRVRWIANAQDARGTVRIDEFTLDHPLLSVEGEGWIGLDGYVQMKATVRTFSIIGRLPLIGNFIDLLARQNIRGPIENPRITQRALSELGGRNVRHPFPLWAPDIPQPDWRRSPALPVPDPSRGRAPRGRGGD